MKLLVTDVDGSLLPFGQAELSPTIIDFFRTLPAQDVRVTFATGKPFARALPLAEALGITTPIICANGALIKDPVTKQTLFREPIDEAVAREVIQLLAHDARCQLYPETDKALFFVKNPAIPEATWRHRRPGWKIPTAYDPATDLVEAMQNVPHKIAVSTHPDDRASVEELLQSRFADTLNVFHPKPDIIDLTSKAVDKGTATHWLMNFLHIRQEDVIVIGDEMNDLPLCAVAGQLLVREHAPDVLLNHADIIIKSGDEALILAIKQALATS